MIFGAFGGLPSRAGIPLGRDSRFAQRSCQITHFARQPSAPTAGLGEIIYVFDGGTWNSEQIAAIHPRQGEIEGVDFVDPAGLPALMAPGNARRALAALHARHTDGAVVLEGGHPITPPPPAS